MALLGGLCASHAAEVLLSSNLKRPEDGIEDITTKRWIAAQFGSDGTYLLKSVTIRLEQDISGFLNFGLYSDAGGKPGQLIGLLQPQGRIGAKLSDITFVSNATNSNTGSGSVSSQIPAGLLPKGVNIEGFNGTFSSSGQSTQTGLKLDANQRYWIVAGAKNGAFAWAFTDEERGSGPGFQSKWAESDNSGHSWATHNTSPMLMEVTAVTIEIFQAFFFDQNAALSTVLSGIPMAVAQHPALHATASTTTNDVNGRLARLRGTFIDDAVTLGLDCKDCVDKETPDTKSARHSWLPIEFFVSGNYGFEDADARELSTGFGSDIYAGSVGAEFHATRNLTFGFAATKVESDHSIGRGVGDVEIDGYALAGYASFNRKNLFFDALYSFGNFEHEIRRDTLFGPQAAANANSHTHTVQLTGGYKFQLGRVITGPFASLNYLNAEISSYDEHRGGTANLHVNAQNFDSLITNIGWQVAVPLQLGAGVIVTPHLRASWAHEFLNEEELVDLSLARSPFGVFNGNAVQRVGRFGVSGKTTSAGNDYLDLGAGVMFQLGQRWSLAADYVAHLFQDDALVQFVSLTGGVRF